MLDGPFNEEFLYLTTVGRKTGRVREIEIWFVERDGRLYVLAEHGYKANWVLNVLANSNSKDQAGYATSGIHWPCARSQPGRSVVRGSPPIGQGEVRLGRRPAGGASVAYNPHM